MWSVVLTLPIWKFRSVDVYDLLVAHEVGHALFTDPRDWSKEDKWKGVPQNFVNITEDARIEKLMKVSTLVFPSLSIADTVISMMKISLTLLTRILIPSLSLIGSICTLNLGLV